LMPEMTVPMPSGETHQSELALYSYRVDDVDGQLRERDRNHYISSRFFSTGITR
jgi:hypothetical protein